MVALGSLFLSRSFDFLKRTQRSSLLNANRPEWDNCQNILFLLYYFAKVLQIRIDEIVHKMLLK